MLVLAIDTATADLVVGVGSSGVGSSGGEVLAERTQTTRNHNELLVPTALEVLEAAGTTFNDLGAVVVGCGPGPFTGLRVGMASASAFGQALGIPVHGVVTHDAMFADAVNAAVNAALAGAESALILTDARRREVYWAHYVGGERVAGPGVCAPADVPVDAVDSLIVPPHMREQLLGQLAVEAREVVSAAAPSAAGLIAAADFTAPPGPLEAHYLRRPDAVPPAPKPKSPALP